MMIEKSGWKRSAALSSQRFSTRLVDGGVFLFTLFISALFVCFCALATPIVFVFSFALDLFDKNPNGFRWTLEDISENAH